LEADRPATLELAVAQPPRAGKPRLALDHIPALAVALGASADELPAPHGQDPRVCGRLRPRPVQPDMDGNELNTYADDLVR